jgi:phenylpyruvate tautomerase PptA (4-oxalocrotonate tautomerase family)
MPIEIRELVIKAVVVAKDKEQTTGLKQEDINKLKKEIIKEVTEKILKTLKQKNER